MTELFSDDEVGPDTPIPKGGYAGRPGSGPDDETCSTCKHFRRVHYHGKLYRKCDYMQWTHGAGTDIKASAAACHRWEEK